MDGGDRSTQLGDEGKKEESEIFEGIGVHGRGGQVGCRGRCKGNINQSENSFDISNPTRWYGKEEWSRLRCNT